MSFSLNCAVNGVIYSFEGVLIFILLDPTLRHRFCCLSGLCRHLVEHTGHYRTYQP